MEKDIFVNIIAERLKLRGAQVQHTIDLLESGCTIPFISRYRKEATGALDEVQIAAISDQLGKLKEIEARKNTILSTIESQDKLTEELKSKIENTWDATALEDLYLPYKPKRRTRAEIAREKGFEPVANKIQSGRPMDYSQYTEEALQGAMDIIAERVSEDTRSRNRLRNMFRYDAIISSKVVKGKEEEGAKFQDYFDFSEKLSRCASHRMLALRRGEAEGVLRLSIGVDDEKAISDLERLFTRGNRISDEYICQAVKDSYKRLLAPSIESEFFADTKEKADAEAIRIFTRNLEQLLMAAPLGQKRVLAIDPGFRTGCKVVCLDAEGNLLTKRYTMGSDGLVEGDYTGWTSYNPLPGEWVLADGRAGNWSSGAAYWWMNFDKENYAEYLCEGALVIGNGPNTVHQIGDVVTSYNMCCGIPFKVTVKYVE